VTRTVEPWVSALIGRTLAAEARDHALAQAVVEVVKALLVAAAPCTLDSHEQAKTARPSVLHYHGVQTDDAGVPMLVLLNCPRCHSTLAVEPDAWLASAVHPPRLEVVR